METSKFLVNGEWRESERTGVVLNPYTGEPAGQVYQASAANILEAIAAAVSASKSLRSLPSFRRAEILSSIAAEIERRKEEFAGLITIETGKPITLSQTEVDRSVFTFGVAAEEARRIEGQVISLDLAQHSAGRVGIVRRFPLGPIAAITPFNFPLNLVAHKLAPAIATGNPVVLKPSSNAPGVALLLAKVVEACGLPAGSLNVVPCSGAEADQLIVNDAIKLISFTGSPGIGWAIKARAGKKKVVLELGGNAGVIIDKDVDIDACVTRIAHGAYANAGQSCIAVQRIFVHDAIFERFVSELVECSKQICVGDPNDAKTLVGPMITENAAKLVEEWVAEAVLAGARVLCGGFRQGAILSPTVLVNVDPKMKVCSQEVFAPVVTVTPFQELAEAVAMVNDSSFGLQAGIFTNDLKGAFRAYEELEVGGVVLNDFPSYRIDHMPYGGVKDSGFGREGVRYAMEAMSEMKLLVLNLS